MNRFYHPTSYTRGTRNTPNEARPAPILVQYVRGSRLRLERESVLFVRPHLLKNARMLFIGQRAIACTRREEN